MIVGVDPVLWIEIALALVLAGAFSGFMSGLLGIGGGGVLVPILYETYGALGVGEDVRMHVAVGTTLAIVAPTVMRSLAAHHKRGAVDWAVVKRFGIPVTLGVVTGIVIASYASSEALRWVWVVAGSCLALKMAIGRDDWRLGPALPGSPIIEIAGGTIGILSTLMGIGGASFTVPFLTLYGMPLLRAVATATGIGAIIAVPALIGYVLSGYNEAGLPPFSLGYINLGALLVIPVAVFMAPLGVRVAHTITKRQHELIFAAFLACVVARFLWTLTT